MSNATAQAPTNGAPFTHNPALCELLTRHFADSKMVGRCYIAYIKAMLKGVSYHG